MGGRDGFPDKKKRVQTAEKKSKKKENKVRRQATSTERMRDGRWRDRRNGERRKQPGWNPLSLLGWLRSRVRSGHPPSLSLSLPKSQSTGIGGMGRENENERKKKETKWVRRREHQPTTEREKTREALTSGGLAGSGMFSSTSASSQFKAVSVGRCKAHNSMCTYVRVCVSARVCVYLLYVCVEKRQKKRPSNVHAYPPLPCQWEARRWRITVSSGRSYLNPIRRVSVIDSKRGREKKKKEKSLMALSLKEGIVILQGLVASGQ